MHPSHRNIFLFLFVVTAVRSLVALGQQIESKPTHTHRRRHHHISTPSLDARHSHHSLHMSSWEDQQGHHHKHLQASQRSDRKYKRQTNENEQKRLVVSISGRNFLEQWTVSVDNDGSLSLVQLGGPQCDSCVIDVEHLCETSYFQNRCCDGSKQTEENTWTNQLHLFRFVAQDRYLCLSHKKTLYTAVKAELNSSSAEIMNCAWYDTRARNYPDVIAYHYLHPDRDLACRENERRGRRSTKIRAADSKKSSRKRCRKLFLTAAFGTTKSGIASAQRRSTKRTLIVVENLTRSENDGISMQLMRYDQPLQRPSINPLLGKFKFQMTPPSSTDAVRPAAGSRRSSTTTVASTKKHSRKRTRTKKTSTNVPNTTSSSADVTLSKQRRIERPHPTGRSWRAAVDTS